MNNRDYHADTTRISKSGLDLFARSPRHYWAKYLDPNRLPDNPTQALIKGQAVHTAILEPHKFNDEYTVLPAFNARTNEGKEQKAAWLVANMGKIAIDIETYELAMRLREKVYAHKTAADLLRVGRPEETMFFEEPETGARCKCRPDFITDDGFILDIKTTNDASPEEFGRSCYKYRYHVQAAFYSQGYELSQGFAPEAFIFIAVETSYPYEVAVYHADAGIVQLGSETYIPELHRYQACVSTGLWPGYGEKIQTLKLPAYAFKKI